MEKLLIIDDSDEIRTQLKWGLTKDYAVMLAGNGKEALSLFKKSAPRVVTLDLGLPPRENGTEEGFRCLQEMLRHNPASKIIVITGNDQRENALKAIQLGAYDFYQKPINLEELRVIIRRAFHLSLIEEENRSLCHALERQTIQNGMIGQCKEMQSVFSTIRKIASSDASVLILGESGTGKELVARSIHDMSLRKDGPFVPINCGAIPETLLESELFGHERGAFTGAHAQVQGKVEYAQNGTLFLDEIGELPPPLQVKLLRFLQDKTIQRVGGRESIPLNTRVLAATNKDLLKETKEGRFREDLYYRLGVVLITVPPLKERAGDIVILASYFLKKYGDSYNKRLRGFSAGALESLEAYEWPGNIRELENKIQRAILLSEAPLITPKDLGFDAMPMRRGAEDQEVRTLKDAKDRVEKELVALALDKHCGNVAKAAEALGISRPTLYDIMKKHGLFNSIPQEEGNAAPRNQ
ncbi:MAG TPA: PEP-CTERM-box response regulator transcription factor [Nitrospirota bacterium]